MDRFVAMAWDAEDPSRQAQINAWSETLQRQSGRWMRVLDRPALRVFSYHHRGDGPVVTPLGNQDGIVIGPLFARGREGEGRVKRLAADEAKRVASSRGERLIKDYWGNYLALWREADTGKLTVLRDPCGAVPCFMTRQKSVDLFFAHAEDVADFPGLEFSIDWTYLQAFILFNYFVTEHSGLNEIKELLAGQRLEIGANGDKHFSWAWNGADIAAELNLQNFEDAKRELRQTADACFTAWGKEYRNIVVSLSGGLDSSILVNLLARMSDANITGLHYVGVGYEQYELKLARLAARKAGIELVEAVQDPAKDDVRRILTAPRLPRPKVQSLAVLIDYLSVQAAERVGADCFMIGQGGDNLFLQRGGAKHTLADYVRLNGVGREFWRVAYDAAMLRQRPIWQAMGDGFGSPFSPHTWEPFAFLDDEGWTKHRPMPADALAKLPGEYMNHPWFVDAARLPRGKADHVVSIVALYNYYIHHGRGVLRDVSYPLFSQPIAEWSLRTPTYTLAHNGLDRAVERLAFANLLPEEIARRTGKGGADHYLLQMMQLNLDFFRELVMDGTLIQKGWLDRARVERMLAADFAIHGGGALFIYLMVSVEAWLQSWGQGDARATRAA